MRKVIRAVIAIVAATGSIAITGIRPFADFFTLISTNPNLGFIIIIVVLLLALIYSTARRIASKRIITRVELLDTAQAYESMLEDAKESSSIFLMSIQENPQTGNSVLEKAKYFEYIEDQMRNGNKKIQRTVAIDNPQKSQRLLSSLNNCRENKNIRINVFTRRINAFNLQVFLDRAIYIVDPIFEVENSTANARHIRIEGRRLEAAMLERYQLIIRESLVLKSEGGVDEKIEKRIERLAEGSEQSYDADSYPFLVYTMDARHNSEVSTTLANLSKQDVSELNWDQLASSIAAEPALVSYEKETLIRRFVDRNAAIVVLGSDIVSYVSIRPIMSPRISDRIFGRQNLPLAPRGFIYEMATGWTRPDYRRRRLSTFLRNKLFNVALNRNPSVLFLSYSKGIGAGPVLSKMGWKRLSWENAPYLSALVGWASEDFFHKTSVGELDVGERKLWHGVHSAIDLTVENDLDKYVTLWVSDSSEALEFSLSVDEQMENAVRAFRSSSFAESPIGGNELSDEEYLAWWRSRLRSHFRDRLHLLKGEKRSQE